MTDIDFYKTLYKLPYDLNELEPVISEKTNTIHYHNHFANYVLTLNKIKTEKNCFQESSIKDIVINSYGIYNFIELYNNAAQIYNHMIFWNSLKPYKIKMEPNNNLKNTLNKYEDFRQKFINEAMNVFGNGWIFVIIDNFNNIDIVTTVNAFNPINMDSTKEIIMCVDLWEHSYYLDYTSKKLDYIINVFDNLIDWERFNNIVAHIV